MKQEPAAKPRRLIIDVPPSWLKHVRDSALKASVAQRVIEKQMRRLESERNQASGTPQRHD